VVAGARVTHGRQTVTADRHGDKETIGGVARSSEEDRMPASTEPRRPARSATMVLVVSATVSPVVRRVRAVVAAVRVEPRSGPALRLPTEGRVVEVDTTGTASTTIDLPVPPGAYRSVRLELATLSARAGPGGDWKLVRAGGVITLPMDCDLRANDRARVDVIVDTDLLVANPKELERAVRTRPSPRGIERSASVARDGTLTFEFSLPPAGTRPRRIAVVAPAGALSPTARVALEEHTPGDLPPLLRHQRAAGPVVRLTSSEPPRSPLEVTVPYDEAMATASGWSVTELVVLALDDDRRVYRELPAARVDRARGTLTARTRRLSAPAPGSKTRCTRC
jgi:hypothetical protein